MYTWISDRILAEQILIQLDADQKQKNVGML